MAINRKMDRYGTGLWWMKNALGGIVAMLVVQAVAFRPVSGMDSTDQPVVTVVVNDTATVTGEIIRLKDIALIRSDEPSLTENVGKIEVGEAPKPGFEKRLTGRWIKSMVPSTTAGSARITLHAPETIAVRRASQTIPEERLLALFQTFLQRLHPDGEVIVSQFKVRGGNLFSQGIIELIPVPDNRKRMGIQTLSVNVTVDGKEEGAILLSGKADIYQKVVCAKTYIERGTTLSMEDVRLNSVNISKAPPDVLTRMEDVSGRLVTVTLREGAFLREKMLSTPPVIEKGDKVKLVAEKGALTIVTMGIAKTGGAEGAQIQVKNISSGKVVFGRVRDASTVEVVF
jgi:flagella basal body P-ring formation protein FlgA